MNKTAGHLANHLAEKMRRIVQMHSYFMIADLEDALSSYDSRFVSLLTGLEMARDGATEYMLRAIEKCAASISNVNT
jgi:hypothetical protein